MLYYQVQGLTECIISSPSITFSPFLLLAVCWKYSTLSGVTCHQQPAGCSVVQPRVCCSAWRRLVPLCHSLSAILLTGPWGIFMWANWLPLTLLILWEIPDPLLWWKSNIYMNIHNKALINNNAFFAPPPPLSTDSSYKDICICCMFMGFQLSWSSL
jgi:hypothetical protein